LRKSGKISDFCTTVISNRMLFCSVSCIFYSIYW